MTLVKFHRPSFYKNFGQHDFGKSFFNEQMNRQKPLVNILENNEGFAIELAAPGLEKSDFSLKVDKNLLIVSAQKEQTSETNYKLREFDFGEFERKFELPNSADTENIEALYEDGILSVKVGKKAEAQPRVIDIH